MSLIFIEEALFLRFYSGKKQCLSQAVYFNISTGDRTTTPFTRLEDFINNSLEYRKKIMIIHPFIVLNFELEFS